MFGCLLTMTTMFVRAFDFELIKCRQDLWFAMDVAVAA